VLRQMPSGVVIAEAPSGEILLSNERANQIRGGSLPPYLGSRGSNGYRVLRPDGSPYEPEGWPLVRTIRTGEEVSDEEMVFVRGDGTRATISANSSPIRDGDGRIVAGVAIFDDITERKRAEEEIKRLNEGLERRVRERTAELERQRATLNTILDNLSEGVLAVDPLGRVLFANPAARSMLGIGDMEKTEGLPDPWRDFDLRRAVARSAGEHESIEARVDGARAPLRVHLEPLPELDGERSGALVVMQDLSEGRRLEMEQQRFLANAAHEFKTPLTAIVGAAELLEDEEDPQIRRRFLDHISEQARRMRRLSETMLRLARVGMDLREPNLRTVDLGDVARRAAESVGPLMQGAGLAIAVEGRGDRARADEEWLEQCLLIVLSNAAKHSEEGGHIRLRAERGTVTVEDEGKGISEEDLPHIFERFYRGSGGPGGFGLGLPICKDLVERMGGEISIESEEGVGTTVKIKLPEAEETSPDAG